MIILIKQCKMSYKNLDKLCCFQETRFFCLKTWKLWQAPTTIEFNIFAGTSQMFLTYKCLQKNVQDFFIILLRSWVICKNKKDWFLHTRFLHFLLMTDDLNKIKEILNTLLWAWLSRERAQNFSLAKFSIFKTNNLVSWK